MKITKKELRRIIKEELLKERGYRDKQLQSAYDSGMSDAQDGYDPGSYHDWIDGDRELMITYDQGYEDGLETPAPPAPADVYKRSAEEMQKIYGDMDVGVRGKAGY